MRPTASAPGCRTSSQARDEEGGEWSRVRGSGGGASEELGLGWTNLEVARSTRGQSIPIQAIIKVGLFKWVEVL